MYLLSDVTQTLQRLMTVDNAATLEGKLRRAVRLWRSGDMETVDLAAALENEMRWLQDLYERAPSRDKFAGYKRALETYFEAVESLHQALDDAGLEEAVCAQAFARAASADDELYHFEDDTRTVCQIVA
jgi:hypothetical protein